MAKEAQQGIRVQTEAYPASYSFLPAWTGSSAFPVKVRGSRSLNCFPSSCRVTEVVFVPRYAALSRRAGRRYRAKRTCSSESELAPHTGWLLSTTWAASRGESGASSERMPLYMIKLTTYILRRVSGTILLISFIGFSSQLWIIWPSYHSRLSREFLELLVPFNFLLTLLFYNYYLCVVTNPGNVPQDWVSSRSKKAEEES